MSARDALFDIAVNRALSYAQRVGQLGEPEVNAPDREELWSTLEVWYLKTRFAYRIPLEDVIDALQRYPGPGHHWNGGRAGGWLEGDPPLP